MTRHQKHKKNATPLDSEQYLQAPEGFKFRDKIEKSGHEYSGVDHPPVGFVKPPSLCRLHLAGPVLRQYDPTVVAVDEPSSWKKICRKFVMVIVGLLATSVLYVLAHATIAFKEDIQNGVLNSSLAIALEAAACARAYSANECEIPREAVEDLCQQWKLCMARLTTDVGLLSIASERFGWIITRFIDALSLRALIVVLVVIYMTLTTLARLADYMTQANVLHTVLELEYLSTGYDSRKKMTSNFSGIGPKQNVPRIRVTVTLQETKDKGFFAYGLFIPSLFCFTQSPHRPFLDSPMSRLNPSKPPVIELSSDDEGPKIISPKKRKPPFEELREEIKRLKTENDLLIAQRDEMAQVVQRLNEDLRESQKRLEDSEIDRPRLVAKLEIIQQTVKTLKEQYKKESQETRRQATRFQDVIRELKEQLSRSDESVSETQRSLRQVAGQLAAQVAKYKHLTTLRREEKQHNQTLTERITALQSSHLDIDDEDIADTLQCGICMSMMKQPFVVPECGHSFCFPCLEQWFSEALNAHKQANPRWDSDDRESFRLPSGLRRAVRSAKDASDILPLLLDQAPQQPAYTCPGCRQQVRFRPVENFSLKTILRHAALLKPNEPLTPAVARDDLWKDFWPSTSGWKEIIHYYRT
ncbi:E3 ubiquitin ligase [Paramarasmius palmivorus]|uniref:E3 ubiquitin ligase n=1 Tax=Paramarasmius palmivorus TaxID=297713 RepID=A0AAW0BDP1_9AGAR